MTAPRTHVQRLETTPAQTGLPATIVNPLWPERFAGRTVAQLGRAVGLTQFGVNHLILEPGAYSALRHWHEGEDEFVFVLSGQAVLIDENGVHVLEAGSYAGFPAGAANAHHLTNRSAAPAHVLVVGTRKVGVETLHYPDDDDFAGPRTVRRDERGERLP
jgi:uncharacterized cupin superfamily protein